MGRAMLNAMTTPQPPVDQTKALADLSTYTAWADTTIDSLSGDNDALRSEAEALAAQNDALRADNERLAAELKACQDNGEPVVTVFGSSRPDQTSGGSVVPVASVRTYLQSGQRPTSVANNSGLRRALDQLEEGGTLWGSHKDTPGSWLDSLFKDIVRLRPDLQIVWTDSHEPFDNYYQVNRMADWVARQETFEPIAQANGVAAVTIAEGWHNPTRDPGYWETMVRENQWFGHDLYNPGIQVPNSYQPPDQIENWTEALAFIAQLGQDKLWVGETGTGVVRGDTSRAGQSQWVADAHTFFAEHAALADWWNSGTDGPLGTGCRLTVDQMNVWLGR